MATLEERDVGMGRTDGVHLVILLTKLRSFLNLQGLGLAL